MNIPLNIDWQQILLHLFNFTILFGALYFLLYSPVKKFMADRHTYYADMDAQTKQELCRAEELKSEYAQKLKDAENEVSKLKNDAQNIAEADAAATKLQAQKEAEKILSDAKAQIERERSKMLTETKKEISGIVARAVEKVVADPNTSAAYDSFLDAADEG